MMFVTAVLIAALQVQQPEPRRAFELDGFDIPESVQHDLDTDLYFVSNITGHGTRRDNTGFISRVRPDGTMENLHFIVGGRGGATLHAPKGMTFRGDTLWVADVDAVRAFHKRTGAPLGEIDLTAIGALLPNDVSYGADGALYITDTGLVFPENGPPTHPGPNRIYRRDRAGALTVLAEGDVLAGPNGIGWDIGGNRLLTVALRGTSVVEWTPNGGARVVANGAGGFDGIVSTNAHRVLVSSLAGGSIQELRDSSMVDLITGLTDPADIGYDRRRNRVLIPSLSTNRIEVWDLAPADPPYTTIEGVMDELYASVTREPGAPFEWHRLRAIMLPEALMLPQPRQTLWRPRVMHAEDFITWIDNSWRNVIGTPNDRGFFERQTNLVVHQYGDIAMAFSTYEKGPWQEPRTIQGRGINTIQLVRRDGRWWIASIAWDEENMAGALPQEYRGE